MKNGGVIGPPYIIHLDIITAAAALAACVSFAHLYIFTPSCIA